MGGNWRQLPIFFKGPDKMNGCVALFSAAELATAEDRLKR
jgi:hypothetical protein